MVLFYSFVPTLMKSADMSDSPIYLQWLHELWALSSSEEGRMSQQLQSEIPTSRFAWHNCNSTGTAASAIPTTITKQDSPFPNPKLTQPHHRVNLTRLLVWLRVLSRTRAFIDLDGPKHRRGHDEPILKLIIDCTCTLHAHALGYSY